MKIKFFILLVVLSILMLVGCTVPKADEDFLPIAESSGIVMVINANHSEFFDNKTNSIMDNLSFFVMNNKSIDMNCSVELSYSNGTDENKTIKYVGLLKPLEQRLSNIIFEMPIGESNLSVKPICD